MLLTCNAAAAQLTSSVIRFVDHAGAVRYGAYAGGGRARALADEASPLSAAGPWAVRDDGATVEDAIISAGVRVGEGTQLRRCVVDRNVEIPANEQIGIDPKTDAERFTVTPNGVVVIPSDAEFT